MPIPESKSPYKRANLFLLRVWCDDPAAPTDAREPAPGDPDAAPCRRWHGSVQRTVTGEAHSFAAKESLIAVLEAMVYRTGHDPPDHPQPRRRGTPRAASRLPAAGPHHTGANAGSSCSGGSETPDLAPIADVYPIEFTAKEREKP